MLSEAYPTTAACSYNGFDFNAASMETVELNARPNYDQAGRVVTSVTYSFTIKDIITVPAPGVDVGSQIESLRITLTKPGGQFRYVDKGMGDFEVNVGTARDVVWGPKPQLLSFRPLGSYNAWEIRWRVDVCVPECTGAYYRKHPYEFNYRLDFAIDRFGYTQRTYTGHIQIPQTRTTPTTRTLEDSADEYLGRVVPHVPEGFRRESVRRSLSLDKCRLDFTFIDEQEPISPPPGVVEASFSHALETNSMVMVQWSGTFRGRYAVASGVSLTVAYYYFLQTCGKRLTATRELGQKGANANGAPIGVGFIGGVIPAQEQARLQPIPTRYTINEVNVYSKRREIEFTMSYIFTLNVKFLLQTPLTVAGVGLSPAGGDDWRGWSQSMIALGPWLARGVAQLKFRKEDDALIDLCQDSAARTLRLTEGDVNSLATDIAMGAINDSAKAVKDNEAARDAAAAVRAMFPMPQPQDAWVRFENRARVDPADAAAAARVILLPVNPIGLR